jgi:cobyrinic acid a,c-diamide synthase
MPGVVIAGTHSGCGKTTVTLGLLAALKKQGLRVQSFKAGPDFIDAGLHRMITGRYSRNLDLWMCGDEYVKECYRRHSADADIAVVEGVMGLYDGTPSTATLASRLELPVILVIDAYGMAETAGAIVSGFRDWGSGTGNGQIDLAGVIFNRVASENHYKRLCAGAYDVPVLGYLPRELEFEIPHRHLGLTVAEEDPMAKDNIDKLADAVLRYIDVEAIDESAARSVLPSFPLAGNLSSADTGGLRTSRNDNERIIAVAYDKAFCFYYEDNLDLLRTAGAIIVRFSPLSDPGIPGDVDAVYIGGGYPELHAAALSENVPMLGSIRKWADSGKPLYAECGGLMYLSKGIHDFDGNFFGMAGVFPFETKMKKGRSKLGHREVTLTTDCLLGKKGAVLRGHEFHYSEIRAQSSPETASHSVIAACPQSFFQEGFPTSGNDNNEATLTGTLAYSVKNGTGEELQPEGYRIHNTLASYIHIHFGSNPEAALNIVRHMRRS